jgi:hypothetical protein
MPQPLSAMMSAIKSGAYARAYEYEVNILGAPVTYPGGMDKLVLRCESINLPGQNIETAPDNIKIGPIREHAFGVNYGQIASVFLADDKLSEKTFFEDWQRKIFTPGRFSMSYYKDYVGDMTIKQFSDKGITKGKPGYQVKLFDVFPKEVSQLDMATANGEFLRVSVTFVYHHWEEL